MHIPWCSGIPRPLANGQMECPDAMQVVKRTYPKAKKSHKLDLEKAGTGFNFKRDFQDAFLKLVGKISKQLLTKRLYNLHFSSPNLNFTFWYTVLRGMPYYPDRNFKISKLEYFEHGRLRNLAACEDLDIRVQGNLPQRVQVCGGGHLSSL